MSKKLKNTNKKKKAGNVSQTDLPDIKANVQNSNTGSSMKQPIV